MRIYASAFILLALLGCRVEDTSSSETQSIVTKGERWAKPDAVPVCVINRKEINAELFNEIKSHVMEEYASKTAIRFARFDDCTAADLKAKVVRLYFLRSHDWAAAGSIKAGGGLSWIGPNAASCGKDCGGGTMYVKVSKNGELPASPDLRAFALRQTLASAVHEFGHAVGLAHEHERADAPQCGGVMGDLKDNSSYVFVGAYDPNSIMNYCKKDNINQLSKGDIAGLAYLYPVKVVEPEPTPKPGPKPEPTPDPKPDPEPSPMPMPTPAPVPAVYSLKFMDSGLCLDIRDWSKDNFGPLQQWSCRSQQANQRFRLIDAGGGLFQLQSVHSGKCVDVHSSSKANDAVVVQYDCHEGMNQRFQFVSAADGSQALKFAHSQRCVDVKSWSKADGGSIIQYDCHGGKNQLVELIKID